MDNSDKRGGKRKPMLATALIAGNNGDFSLDCTIRESAPRGVRIGVARGTALPDLLYLVNIRERMAHETHVAWRQDGEAGLAIRRSWPLSDVTNPALGFLKKLWYSRMAR